MSEELGRELDWNDTITNDGNDFGHPVFYLTFPAGSDKLLP